MKLSNLMSRPEPHTMTCTRPSMLNRVSNSWRRVNMLTNGVSLRTFLLILHSCSCLLETVCSCLALKDVSDLRNVALVCHK